MTLDSASREPLLLGYPERLWPHQPQMLSPLYTPAARYDRRPIGDWSKHNQPSPEPCGSNFTKGRDQGHARSTYKGVLEQEVQLPWQTSAYPHKEQKPNEVVMTTNSGNLSRELFRHWPKEQQSDDVIVTSEIGPRTSSWQHFAYENKNNLSAKVNVTSWQRFAYENEKNRSDVNMTSYAHAKPCGKPWQTFAVRQANDQSSADVRMTSYRERSQSTGSWRSLGTSRASSGSSLANCYLAEDHSVASGPDQRLEALPETTYRELVKLWASNRVHHQRQWDPERTASCAEGPSFQLDEARRRYSEASQRQHLKDRLQKARQRYDELPIDMTCRKRQTKMVNLESSGHSVGAQSMLSTEGSAMSKTSSRTSTESSEMTALNPEMTPCSEGHDQQRETDLDNKPGDQSILRSMLTERSRSYSMSVLELRRRRLQANRVGSACPSDVQREGTERTRLASIGAAIATNSTFCPAEKQLVTLAKKNLLPVTARITDLLGRIVEFARSVPEFLQLSLTDREAILSSACLRLLVLFMAETNLQFATTVISVDRSTPEDPKTNGEGLPVIRTEQGPREPTVQFVGSLQNFVRKCQALNVTGEEYFYMKLITLFHSGVGSSDCVQLSGRMNSVARQDLQDSVHRCHPTERLRYSTLLLSLHTLFGIHCDMLRSLFCQHLNRTGGLQAFIGEALATEAGEKKEEK